MPAPHPSPAPTRAFRIAQGVLALLLCAQIGLVLRCAFDAQCAAVPWWLALYGALNLAGLLRRVAWGRFLTSMFMLLCTINLAAWLIGNPDAPGRSGLERIFGGMPPLWLGWLTVVAACLLALAPLLVIGWRRDYFRWALW
jgi:hypothetical protein